MKVYVNLKERKLNKQLESLVRRHKSLKTRVVWYSSHPSNLSTRQGSRAVVPAFATWGGGIYEQQADGRTDGRTSMIDFKKKF